MNSNLVKRVVDKVTLGSQVVAQSIMMVMVLLTTADVAGRYLFNHPIPGTLELIELLLVAVVFLSFAYVELKDGNVRVELVIARLRPTVRLYMECLLAFISLIMFFILAWQSVLRFIYLQKHGDVTGYLHLPISPFLLVIAFSCALMGCQLILRFWRFADQIRRKK